MESEEGGMDGEQNSRQVKVVKLQRQVVMHAGVRFHVNTDGASTQLLKHRLIPEFLLSEPQLNRQLEVCVLQALLYLQHTTRSLGQRNWVKVVN